MLLVLGRYVFWQQASCAVSPAFVEKRAQVDFWVCRPQAAWVELCTCTASSFVSSSELVVRLVGTTTGALVVLLDDRGADALDLLLLLLDLLSVGLRVAREPVLPILDGIIDGLLLVLVHL